MTETLYFEANSDRCLELDTLAARLATTQETLLTEALEMLLAAYRDRTGGNEQIGLLADLHGLQGRVRAMVDELLTIRFMTSTVDSMLYEMDMPPDTCRRLCRHYDAIFQKAERALKAAGIGPTFRPVPLEHDEQHAAACS